MIGYYASDMNFNVHSDALYLYTKNAQSRDAVHFFLGWTKKDSHPIRLDGAIFTMCTVLKFIATSAAEAKLGTLFKNKIETKNTRLTLHELVHNQPPTPIYCNMILTIEEFQHSLNRNWTRVLIVMWFCWDKSKTSMTKPRYWQRGFTFISTYMIIQIINTANRNIQLWICTGVERRDTGHDFWLIITWISNLLWPDWEVFWNCVVW